MKNVEIKPISSNPSTDGSFHLYADGYVLRINGLYMGIFGSLENAKEFAKTTILNARKK